MTIACSKFKLHHFCCAQPKWSVLLVCTIGTAEDFKPQIFPIKIILLKRGTLQLSNAKKFSSIHQGTAKLQEFKVEWFWESFVTVTMGRANLTAPSGLLFDPDNGSFAYIPTGRCRRWTKADLLLFSVQIFMHTVHWPCLLCSDTRRRSHVLKDNNWHDVTRNFGMGELRGSGGRAAALVNFRVAVLGLETLWRPILKLLGPKLAKQAHVSSPPQYAAWFWNCGTKLSCTQFQHRSPSLTTKKKASCTQAETTM